MTIQTAAGVLVYVVQDVWTDTDDDVSTVDGVEVFASVAAMQAAHPEIVNVPANLGEVSYNPYSQTNGDVNEYLVELTLLQA